MYGVVTRNAEELDWPEFDRAFYEVKDVTGRHTDPVENAVNMVSCFGDNATAGTEPDLVPVDDEGNRATREQPYFDWAYICPLAEDYRTGVLTVIETCAELNEDVRLDDVGFPRAEYCHCERCETAFSESDVDDWYDWRASVITEFVAEAADRIPGRTYLTLYPDPYPGHLYERAGLDLDALSAYVDEFVVPLYDTHYGTTYWLETIASGFQDALDAPLSIELYAVNVDVENLVHAAEVADEYAKDVFFGYEASNSRAALRRMGAEEREGKTFGSE
ncbi:hypothetical protein [Halobacterium wangiae]|uniref:hypothetical protein n=1 Tax=Halobacterium wangiae TaxID=2902623 RepID=UPI001E627C15|nr:hypothetical protein [Halobacterium wangiae]